MIRSPIQARKSSIIMFGLKNICVYNCSFPLNNFSLLWLNKTITGIHKLWCNIDNCIDA